MVKFIPILVSTSLAVLFAIIFGLQKSWQVAALCAAHGMLFSGWLSMRSLASAPPLPPEYRFRQSTRRLVWRSFALGVLWGLATVTTSLVFLAVIPHIPMFAEYCDDERERVTRLLAEHESAQRYSAAITLIDQTLKSKISVEWSKELRHQRVRLLAEWSEIAAHPQNEALLQEAVDYALQHGFDATTFRLKLDVLKARRLETENAKALASKNAVILQFETEASQQHERLLEMERVNARQDADFLAFKSSATTMYAAKQVELLLRWAEFIADDPENQLPLFDEAIQIAQRYQLPSTNDINVKRQLAADRLANMQPRKLPENLTCTIIRTDLERHPVIEADLSILSANGNFHSGLQAKDLLVRQNGKRIQLVYLAEQRGPSEKQQILLLVDRSTSMQGKPMESVKQGLRQLIEKLPAAANIRLMSFATTVDVVVDWTTDRRMLLDAIDRLKADGATSLNNGITVALQNIAQREGLKFVLLFTDGKDSGGVRDAPATLRLATQTRVPLHTVAYTKGEIDRDFLSQLATVSGGTFSEIAQVESLTASLVASAERMTPRFYRLVFVTDLPSPITIEFGKQRSPTTTIDIPATRRTAARP